mmetsp:Transcript_36814/g.57552  ORF Transcript_36814/g.57552 Transcript_36814/m.57552 type:complete len:477 (+) Transcript_36814:1-1431(+)
MASYGAIPLSSSAPSFHRQAMAVVAAIAAVVLVAAAFASHNAGRYVGLLEEVPAYAPYVNAQMLAQSHAWEDELLAQQRAEKAAHKVEKKVLNKDEAKVGKKLAKDMKAEWSAKSATKEWADFEKAEMLKARYEAIERAMKGAPVLRQMAPGPQGPRVINPATGQAYSLYEYHVPGGYEDAELMPDEPLASDLKGIAPFTNAIDRVDTYQGTYPEYKVAKGQALYDDQPLIINPIFENDEKDLSPFQNADTRVHTYQGTYPEYASQPQVLQVVDLPIQQQQAPQYFVMKDRMGRMVLVDSNQIQGLEAEKLHQEQQAMAMRKRMLVQMAQLRAQKAKVAKTPKAKALKSKAKKARTHKPVKKADARTEMLSALPQETEGRNALTVFEPKLIPLPDEAAKADPNPLGEEAKKEYTRWHDLASSLSDVYDPTEDTNPKHNMPHHDGVKNGNWWSAHSFDGNSGKSDAWWTHDHTNRGY